MAEFVSNCSMILFLLVFLLLRSSGSHGHMQQVPAIFVFGDSSVDVGNNNYLPLSLSKANFPHNGIDFQGHEVTGRFSNGKNAVDLLAEKLGLPSPPPYLSTDSSTSYLSGVSFASGGAAILTRASNLLNTQSIPLWQQVQYYLKVHEAITKRLGPSGAQQHLSKSLFFIVIGGNDILDYFRLPDLGKPTPQEYVNQMIMELKSQIKILHSNGARKFMVPGLPPVGCCPSQRIQNETRGCREDTNTWTIMYNEALASMLQSLKSSELKEMSYSYSHAYPLIYGVIRDPASYGFKEVRAACCGLGDLKAVIPCLPTSTYCPNRRDHLFWDLYHFTEATNRLFVDNVFDGPPRYTSPINAQQLIAL